MDLLKRIEQLEYHQQLLLQIIENPNNEFSKLIVWKKLTQEEVVDFYHLCDEMSKKLEEQKADGFVYFYPLLNEFSEKLNDKLDVKETIFACLKQNLYIPLMKELAKLI